MSSTKASTKWSGKAGDKSGPKSGPMTGARILWECLEREGVKTVFGYPGGAILPAYDALRHSSIRHILVRHEQGATHMADGYARATGDVGVAVATSGPGATNMVTGIATAMMDSSPIVCITGQVGSKLLGSDAFQETDITGVTLPITKHNYLVTRADEIAPAVREALYVAKSGRPGPGADRHHQGRAAELLRIRLGSAPRRRCAATVPIFRPAKEYRQGAGTDSRREAPADSRRPRHRWFPARSTKCRRLPSAPAFPWRMTLLGLGALPASHVLNLGMMGMHGEAWVNNTIQEADLLIALGMRFDDRVTGNLKTYAPNAKKIHIDIDPAEINKNVKVDVALVGDLRKILHELLPRVETARPQRVARHHPRAQGRLGRARHSEPAGQRASLRRARDQRSVARDARPRHDRRHRRGPAPDVGSAVLQARTSAVADHLRRTGHHGLRAARGHRRESRPARCGRLGGRAATAASR